jgi:hypothetical protein
MSILNESVTSRDIFVFVFVVAFLFTPFAPVQSPNQISVVFVSNPPSGNSSVALATLLHTNSVNVTLYQMNTWCWYVFVQVLGAFEIVVLYFKLRTLLPGSGWCYSSVLEHGGVCLANTEFWIFMAVHHILLCIFALQIASLYGVLVLVMAYVAAVAFICEPNYDCGHEYARQELYTNRVVLIAASIITILYLFSRDEQIHNMILKDSEAATLFSSQLFLDFALMFAHYSANAEITFVFLTRLLYIAACNIVLFVWFVV